MDVLLFILGYYVHLAASCLLLYKIRKTSSIYGLSWDTQVAYLMATFSRCIWVLDTRLVETWFAYLELLASTVMSVILCACMWKYFHTTTKHATPALRIWVLAPVAFVLAVLFHPGDAWWSLQVAVAFTMYIEALGMVPQLWLMRHMTEIEPVTSHYVAMLIIARIIRMFFWGALFMLGEHFLQLFISDILHTVLAGDFLYLWAKKLQSGGRLIYAV